MSIIRCYFLCWNCYTVLNIISILVLLSTKLRCSVVYRYSLKLCCLIFLFVWNLILKIIFLFLKTLPLSLGVVHLSKLCIFIFLVSTVAACYCSIVVTSTRPAVLVASVMCKTHILFLFIIFYLFYCYVCFGAFFLLTYPCSVFGMGVYSSRWGTDWCSPPE
jgi:hypothetical protein